MKSVVIYYSQTGNTKQIAQAIHKGIAQRAEHCDLVKLKEIHPEELESYDLIGLGSPVWASEPAPNVLAFIESLPSSLKGKHSFFFCTHGTTPGHVISKAVSELRQKGLIVVGWEDWYGSVFLARHPKPYFTDGHPDDIDLNEAEIFGLQMAERSLEISQGATELIPKLPEGKDYTDIYGVDAHPHGGRITNGPEMKINEEKCTRCMLCADNCPINNIDFSVSPPIFKERNCYRCYFCEGICPTGAIECDFSRKLAWEEGNKDTGPVIPKFNFFNQSLLNAAEAKGRFRRLVPLEDIGWDTTWEKVSKHPRLKII
jgi:flavodoxin/ferredoxin